MDTVVAAYMFFFLRGIEACIFILLSKRSRATTIFSAAF